MPLSSTTNPKPKQFVPTHKFDPAGLHRAEIEARTAAGETCEQIAAAIRAHGVDITNKTISRRRLEWGLRKRPQSKLLGKKSAAQRPRTIGTKHAGISLRKAEIEARTQRGETAEEIAEFLESQGCKLKKGASTVLRLQTQWRLIEPDEDRARGRKRKIRDGEVEGGEVEVRKVRKRDLPRMEKARAQEANKTQQMQAQTLHYPSNCSFGPKKRVGPNGTAGEMDEEGMMMDGDEAGFMDDDGGVSLDNGNGDPNTMPVIDPSMSNSQQQQQLPYPSYPQQQPFAQHPQQNSHSVSVAAEIMSVEFLVDLANSTLGAANNLKDLLLAYQARQPIMGSVTGLPPSADDLTTARRKVREAAAVMHDLAAEPKE